MNNIKQIVKVTLAAIFMIAVMVVIFLLSNQNGEKSIDTSDSVGDTIKDILDIEVPPGETISSVPIGGFNIRKYAHIFLYMLLGLSSFLFVASLFSLKRIQKTLTPLYVSVGALLISFVYACTDEFHQYFVAGRTASFADVCIDAIGFVPAIAFCGIVMYVIFINLKRKDG